MNVLDERIRRIAREEAAGLTESAPGVALETSGPDRLAELETQLTALTERVTELEKTAAAPAPAKRAPRKTAEPSE